MRILYVEDNDFDADLTQRSLHLALQDSWVEIARSVGEASRLLRSPPDADRGGPGDAPRYDVVLTDMHLPDGNGFDVLGDVRGRHLPMAVVMVTGHGDEESVVTALKAGADDYIAKHGDYLDRLAATLTGAVEHFRGMQQKRRRRRRVLYAENSPTDADIARRQLVRTMPEVDLEIVATLAEFMERLPSVGPDCDYDVLMLDFRPPMIEALDTLKALRRIRGIETPALVVTGHGDESTAQHALELGATDYLVKGASFMIRLPVVVENALLRGDLEAERRALRDSEARFRELAENVPAMFWMCDPDVRRMLYVSPACRTLWGCDAEQLMSSPHARFESVHPDDRERARAALEVAASDGVFDQEYRVIRPDGSIRIVHDRTFPVHDAAGARYRLGGLAEDVTWRREQEDRIRHQAYHDALTGLPNRALLADRLGQALARAARHKECVALLFLDLDRFKAINDTIGHAGGDELLRIVGARLRGLLREEDTVARVGGDEFVVVLPFVSTPADAAHVAEKIAAAMDTGLAL